MKYDAETKAKTVRLVREQRDDYATEWDAIHTIASRKGMGAETLRTWIRQAEIDYGEAEGV